MHILVLTMLLHTAPVLHISPSASLYELRFSGAVGQLTPGLGIEGRIDFNNGIGIGADVFGSAIGLATAHPGYAFSVAPFICFEPWGVCPGIGIDLANVNNGVSGLFQGFRWKNNTFFVLQLMPSFFELLHIKM